MHQLQIIYETPSGNRTVTTEVPEHWNELSKKQLLQVMRALGTTNNKHLLQRYLLQVLLHLKHYEFNALPAEHIYELAHLTDFLTEETNLTTQLLPKVSTRLTVYHGPEELLVNISFAEFIEAEKHFIRYIKSQDITDLNHLIATLYRPQRWLHHIRHFFGFYSGDNRATFNEHLITGRAAKLASLSDEEKLAIFTWYRGCRNALERLYPYVFSSEKEERSDAASTGWEPVLRGMAGVKFGDVDSTGKKQAHQILREMNEQIKLAEEMERKYAKA